MVDSSYEVVTRMIDEELSLKELMDLREVLAERIELAKDEAKEVLRQKLQAIVETEELGVTAEELFGSRPTRGRRPAKYANPNNPEQKWSGAGKRPAWFIEKLGEGLVAEQMEIAPLQF